MFTIESDWSENARAIEISHPWQQDRESTSGLRQLEIILQNLSADCAGEINEGLEERDAFSFTEMCGVSQDKTSASRPTPIIASCLTENPLFYRVESRIAIDRVVNPPSANTEDPGSAYPSGLRLSADPTNPSSKQNGNQIKQQRSAKPPGWQTLRRRPKPQ